MNPNKGVPRIAQIQKVYTDDPTGIYYDVKFRETGDITQTVEAYLHAIDGSPVSEAFGKLTEKMEKYEAKQKAIKNPCNFCLTVEDIPTNYFYPFLTPLWG